MGGPKAKGAREAALLALLEMEERGAYAAIARDRALGGLGLPERDRAFATELIFGVTRHRRTLDYVIDAFTSRPTAHMDPVARNSLRLGAYQILHLERVPARAAVNESVELARRFGHEGTASFVNGVLRSMLRDPGRVRFPDSSTDPVAHIALKHSHPDWMVARWLSRFGLADTTRLCEANNERPPLTLRVNTLKTTVAQAIRSLSGAGISSRPSPHVPEAVEVTDSVDITHHPCYRDGAFFIQDSASMLVAYALDPRPGDAVVDLAAAPGGKATHIAERMLDRGLVVAVDLHEHRKRLIDENASRLGLRSVRAVRADATRLPPDLGRAIFDRALIDAPCSGTGVLRRRPDLRWHRQVEDLEGLVELQLAILSSGASLVKPGGVIVYSTCSIEPEENASVIRKFLEARKEFEIEPARPYLPSGFSAAFEDQGLPFVETLPHVHGMDGFFIARLVRSRDS